MMVTCAKCGAGDEVSEMFFARVNGDTKMVCQSCTAFADDVIPVSDVAEALTPLFEGNFMEKDDKQKGEEDEKGEVKPEEDQSRRADDVLVGD